ncbi:MAG: lipoprotein [Rhodospirillaceae bacterium]|nr:MAG: lipoprotein [Rhodospirillaceae bacterium]
MIRPNPLKPAAEGYRVLPQPARDGVHNFLTNWQEPLVFIHDLLQGEVTRAGETLIRFLTNTTIGFSGVGDVAGEGLGLHHHDEDMGQTLAVWGVDEGPYMMLPLLGPSNARDTIGRVVDFVINPITFVLPIPVVATVGKIAVEGVDQRERHLEALDDVERTSIDFYASIRTLYRQRRAEEIRNGGTARGNGMFYEIEHSRTLGMSSH